LLTKCDSPRARRAGKGIAVNASQILTVDRVRLARRLGSLSAERMREADRAIKISLGLE